MYRLFEKLPQRIYIEFNRRRTAKKLKQPIRSQSQGDARISCANVNESLFVVLQHPSDITDISRTKIRED